jgi:hypothetical protein
MFLNFAFALTVSGLCTTFADWQYTMWLWAASTIVLWLYILSETLDVYAGGRGP